MNNNSISKKRVSIQLISQGSDCSFEHEVHAWELVYLTYLVPVFDGLDFE